MCNCNQQRAMLTSGNTQSRNGVVKVMLTENTPMIFNGNITGRMYVYRNRNDYNWVDKRDVMSMKEIPGLQVIY